MHFRVDVQAGPANETEPRVVVVVIAPIVHRRPLGRQYVKDIDVEREQRKRSEA